MKEFIDGGNIGILVILSNSSTTCQSHSRLYCKCFLAIAS